MLRVVWNVRSSSHPYARSSSPATRLCSRSISVLIIVKAGVELAYTSGRPVVVLRGVSVMGVPIPNAWLGNLKNVDLVGEFGADEGFWAAFADGVDDISVKDGSLDIRLRP